MRIPKKLKIGGHTFKVVLVTPDLDSDNCGQVDRDKNRILISSTIERTQQESTLIHEILHILCAPLDHALLDSLAEQLYQVLHDNKLLNEDSNNELV